MFGSRLRLLPAPPVHLKSREPEAERQNKEPCADPRRLREPNAGLVFLTMTCLSYLVFYGVRENVPITAYPLLFADNSLYF